MLVSAKAEGRGLIWSQTFCIPLAHVDTIDSDAMLVLPTFDDDATTPTVLMNLVTMRLLCRLAELLLAVHLKAFTIKRAIYRFDMERCCPWVSKDGCAHIRLSTKVLELVKSYRGIRHSS